MSLSHRDSFFDCLTLRHNPWQDEYGNRIAAFFTVRVQDDGILVVFHKDSPLAYFFTRNTSSPGSSKR